MEDGQLNKQSESSLDPQSSQLKTEVPQTTQLSQHVPNEQLSPLEKKYKDLLSSIQLVIGRFILVTTKFLNIVFSVIGKKVGFV